MGFSVGGGEISSTLSLGTSGRMVVGSSAVGSSCSGAVRGDGGGEIMGGSTISWMMVVGSSTETSGSSRPNATRSMILTISSIEVTFFFRRAILTRGIVDGNGGGIVVPWSPNRVGGLALDSSLWSGVFTGGGVEDVEGESWVVLVPGVGVRMVFQEVNMGGGSTFRDINEGIGALDFILGMFKRLGLVGCLARNRGQAADQRWLLYCSSIFDSFLAVMVFPQGHFISLSVDVDCDIYMEVDRDSQGSIHNSQIAGGDLQSFVCFDV